MKYNFWFKKGFFWKKRVVVGHRYEESQNKMILFSENGGIEEIPDWKNYGAKLSVDWVLAVKHNMEQQTGQPVTLAVDTNAK